MDATVKPIEIQWDEIPPEVEADSNHKRKRHKTRWRDIEDRMADRQLEKELNDSYLYDD